MICVVDSGSGNLRSLCNGLRAAGLAPRVVLEPPARAPEVLVLPGVGAFGHAAAALEARGWREAIPAFLEAGTRLVGICLGMQLLFESSEESPGTRGLGLLRGTVRRLDASRAKVPHIGWERLRFETGKEGALPWAYFVHSFVVVPGDLRVVKVWAAHGGREFPAAVRSENVAGVQFHPEKSQGPGLAYLAALVGGAW